jgi:hypothetical protein
MSQPSVERRSERFHRWWWLRGMVFGAVLSVAGHHVGEWRYWLLLLTMVTFSGRWPS